MAALRKPESGDLEAIRAYADQLYKEEKWRELFEYLQEKLGSGNDPDLAWRLLRCGFRYGRHALDAGDSREAERIADAAMERGKRALEEKDHFALHKWIGILLQLFGDIKGMKNKIENSYKIKEHFMKAIEIRPDDLHMKHLVGRWCFEVASVTWLQRRIASAIFASPPTSSYDEAFSYFNAAEQAKPGFFKPNWLWLGKTLIQLKRSEGKEWLQKLMDAEAENIDEKEAKKEAKELLKGL